MNNPIYQRVSHWCQGLAERRAQIKRTPELVVEGQLIRMVGFTLEAVGCVAPIGSRCLVKGTDGHHIEAEVVGFSGDRLYLMPSDHIHGMVPHSRVLPTGSSCHVPVGDGLLGRVLDGAGQVIDSLAPPRGMRLVSLSGKAINPLDRKPIREPLDVGIRAINALLTVGRGQRMGLFAGSGVGKSVLLGMMTRFTNADIIVVGLIGERGREVQEFIQEILGPEGMARAVVVAAPADDPPLKRLHGAALATRIAEDFRAQGKQVLLLMDSLTRYAQAQREIALAIGEPPATKGYPPSVFAKLPQLVERAGNDALHGSVTAFYTVLTEGDDQQDPIADAARAILDGHIILSRQLAEAGHYPAIDIEASVSRAMSVITDNAQQQLARRFKQIYSTYEQHRDLINIGAYTAGSDPAVDEARRYYPRLRDFLIQTLEERVTLVDSINSMALLLRDE